MSFGRGLSHLVLLGLEGCRWLVHPLVGGLQRLSELRWLALMRPVGTENLLTTIVDIERLSGNQPAMSCLYQAAFSR
jgi:hypothetical protein